MKTNLKNTLILQLFAEGEGTGEAPAAEVETGEAAPAAAEQDIDYDAEFALLTKKGGKYEKPYQKQMQKAFNKRFSEFKERERLTARLEAFKDTVAKRYSNVDASDLDALEEAFRAESKMTEERAPRNGEIEEKLGRLFSERLAALQRAASAKEAKQFYDRLCREESELKERYSDFDLARELKDARFKEALLIKNTTLEDAYWLVHRADLIKEVARAARDGAISHIASRGMRAPEGATSPTLPQSARIDYANMSDAAFMELYNRNFK